MPGPNSRSLRVIVPGLAGCFLTCVASVAANLVADGWRPASGWTPFVERLSLGYAAADVVVVVAFPALMPALSRWMDLLLERTDVGVVSPP